MAIDLIIELVCVCTYCNLSVEFPTMFFKKIKYQDALFEDICRKISIVFNHPFQRINEHRVHGVFYSCIYFNKIFRTTHFCL